MRPVGERFWEKVDRRGADECWLWTASTDRYGYGQFWGPSGLCLAHRFAYELVVRPIPVGLKLDHVCHTNDPSCSGGPTCPHRRCVNPAHLEAVTAVENTRRGRSFSTVNAAKTHCPAGHAYTPSNTYRTPQGHRDCRQCVAARARRYKQRKAA